MQGSSDDAMLERVKRNVLGDPGQRPATWRGSVLPALREAVAGHPILRGAELVHGVVEVPTDGPVTIEARVGAEPWALWGKVRCDTIGHVVEDAGALVGRAADAALAYRASGAARSAPLGCPVCDGELPSTCHRCGSGRALVEPTSTKPASERTPLPPGWTWDPEVVCAADGPGEQLPYVILVTEGRGRGKVTTHDGRPAPADVLAALRTEAQRLGLPWVEPERPSGDTPVGDIVAAPRLPGEDDQALAARALLQVDAVVRGTLAAIEAAVLAVPGVQRCIVQEWRSASNLRITVEGERYSAEHVGMALLAALPHGVTTEGDRFYAIGARRVAWCSRPPTAGAGGGGGGGSVQVMARRVTGSGSIGVPATVGFEFEQAADRMDALARAGVQVLIAGDGDGPELGDALAAMLARGWRWMASSLVLLDGEGVARHRIHVCRGSSAVRGHAAGAAWLVAPRTSAIVSYTRAAVRQEPGLVVLTAATGDALARARGVITPTDAREQLAAAAS